MALRARMRACKTTNHHPCIGACFLRMQCADLPSSAVLRPFITVQLHQSTLHSYLHHKHGQSNSTTSTRRLSDLSSDLSDRHLAEVLTTREQGNSSLTPLRELCALDQGFPASVRRVLSEGLPPGNRLFSLPDRQQSAPSHPREGQTVHVGAHEPPGCDEPRRHRRLPRPGKPGHR